MTYFANVKSYEDLKAQYRTLAMENHPDQGGDLETMKAINGEYDQLFPIWKHRSANTTTETAASTRSEFYTQNGWKGENYNSKLSLKEIACIVREFIKIHYNDFKFSVTTSYASMCQELHIYLTEGPERAYKTFDELTYNENQYDCEYNKVVRKYTQEKNIASWYKEEINNIIQPMYDKDFGESERLSLPKFLSDGVREAVEAVNDYAKSFNYSDCDGMIDYFDVNFYFFGVQIGKWDKPYKIVPRARKNVASVEYENVEVTKTRTKKVLEPREIETPAEFAPSQLFQLKASFNYGCYRGAVYQIDRISDGGIIYGYKMGKGYKNVCKGQTRGNHFPATPKQFQTWLEKGAIVFVELAEVTKTEEYTSTVRRPKKTTAVSTEVRTDAEAAEVRATTGIKEYTITPDTDTRDGSALWVVKFAERMNREEYQETAGELKKIKGYYSKYKKGFIFRYDPAEKLAEMFDCSECKLIPA